MRMTKPVKILVVSTATVFGLAGAAAAAAGPFTPFEGDDPVLETTTVAPTPESTEAPTPESTEAPEQTTTVPETSAPTTDPELDAGDDGTGTDTGTESTAFECPEGATNHGEVVSSVAHATPPGPGHGAAVSEAARSDCGKVHDDEALDDGSDDAADDGSDDAVEPEASTVDGGGSSHGKGHGRDADHGRGKGRGHR